MSFWTYLLHCADGSYYAGQTDDLDRRIGQHQAAEVEGYTWSRRPVKLACSQPFATREEVMAAEQQIEGWGRGKNEAMIRGDWTEVRRLAWGTRNPLPEDLK